MRRILIGGAAVLVLLVALGGGVVLWARHVYSAPGPLAAATDIVLPHGGSDAIAQALATAGAINSPRRLHIAALLTDSDGPLHAGEFAFPAAASLAQVLDVLRHARPVEHRLTIPEGLTAAQIATLITAAPALTGKLTLPPEGAILPQTYAYEYGTPRNMLVARMAAALHQALDAAWAGRAPDLPLASPQQALILASIVERETALPAERPHVAAVFLNRLRLGMRLQSDPTVVYVASGGLGRLDRPLSRADLAQNDPYNTYQQVGLPPGPICAPGMAAIRAVLHPMASDDLYFVADGSGGHVFARTLEDHDRNVGNWRAHRRN